MATPNKKLLWGFYNVQNQRKVERQALKPRKKKKREKNRNLQASQKLCICVAKLFIFEENGGTQMRKESEEIKREKDNARKKSNGLTEI